MNGLLAGTRRIQVEVLDNLGLDDTDIGFRCGVATKIDFDHAAAGGFRWRQSLQRGAEPIDGWFCEVEIAIDPRDHSFCAEFGEPFIDTFADCAELRISGVAERQNSVFDAVETRRALIHQLGVDPRRSAGWFALAPGGGDDHKALRRAERRQIEIGHIDYVRLEAELARQLRRFGS